MAATIHRTVSLAFGATTLALFVGTLSAQERDPLPEVRERLKIETQRIEKELQDNRMRAYRLFRKEPEEALNILKGLISMLHKDTVLPEERRKALLALLQRDIDNVRALASLRWTITPANGSEPVLREPASAQATPPSRSLAPRVGEGTKSPYDIAAQRIRQMND